ncbi:MAG: UDP-N-acetylglucosamine 4,6-dehydratase (inverting) [Candidatus Dormibacteraeota bacterium]|uniref:UDP-N-acetylglucosamine 4,6-dehydratase (Inverting) n=1 Tax=Candidatus Aeolococcus gillhamiae TaxID=3127015 RepID=A0A2W5Z574_9BACT|nr:UDP-N-acetylglucosamine 4,6-dehydratase (inverting) [Candidatus Dormibacteraeota bacterium]PZR80403.1 MAG: UDP-N-acetylglucosamine 4,6-dehydratase (inverting) [Candidatus Dormibacter sp. RRmetagenome_bin12]
MNVFDGRTILVTGGTGSFGNHFTRALLAHANPAAVRIFSRDELKQSEMARRIDDPRLRFLIGDVRDRDRLRRAVDGVDIVVHAAALKQVPACEYNPFEAVRTNILGAQNVAEVCIDAGVPRAVALSTDKAVSPANLYGATKLCAERLFIQANVYAGAHQTLLSCVRYGNVVGSRGSVIPLFLDQASSGELTVTDERMTRFWITLDQAVAFVVECISRMQGGELFIPKIPSMRVLELAEAVAPGLPIRYTGIRPGEKLHESLITPEEARHTLDAGWCYVVEPEHQFWGGRQIPGATPVAEDFVYSSDRNTEWLDVDALRGLLASGQRIAEPAAIEVG